MKRSCPICGNSELKFIYKRDFSDKGISFISSYDVVSCKVCGFVFASEIPTQNKFNTYYSINSKYEFKSNSYIAPQTFKDHAKAVVDFIIPNIPNKNIDILDIGCSTGTLLNEFKSRGYNNLLGIDPSDCCAKATKELYDIDAVGSTISSYKSDRKFDLITLVAVVEHIVDLKKSLKKVISLLKPNGMLFMDIPDIELFHKHIYGPFHQFHTEHINYFSSNSIKNLLSLYSHNFVKIKKQFIYRLPNIPEPDLFILSKKENINKGINYDYISGIGVEKYVRNCRKLEKKLDKKLEKNIYNIIVWGSGDHSRWLMSSFIKLPNILYFVDSDIRYIGKKFCGKPIKLPTEIRENVPILISSYFNQKDIVKEIENKKITNKIITLY